MAELTGCTHVTYYLLLLLLHVTQHCSHGTICCINRDYTIEVAASLVLKMGGSTIMSESSIRVLTTEYRRNGKSLPFSIIPIRL